MFFRLTTLMLALADPPGTGITITGPGRCPAPEAVAQRAAALLPAGIVPEASAALEETDATLVIVLRDGGGAVAGERRLPRAGLACDQLAGAAATVVATWLSDVHPNYAPPAAAPAIVVRDNRPASLPGPAPRRWQFAGLLGLLGSLAPGGGASGWAAGVWGGAGLRAAAFPLGARLVLAGESERRFPVGAGAALSRRLWVGLGPVLHGRLGPADLEVAVAATAARFTLRGEGFARDLATGTLDWGASAGLLVTSRRRFSPFLHLELTAWPVAHTAVEFQGGASVVLPRLAGGLVLGVRTQGP